MEKDNILYKKFIYFLEKSGDKKFNKKRFRNKASRREMLLNVLEQIFKRLISYSPLLVE